MKLTVGLRIIQEDRLIFTVTLTIGCNASDIGKKISSLTSSPMTSLMLSLNIDVGQVIRFKGILIFFMKMDNYSLCLLFSLYGYNFIPLQVYQRADLNKMLMSMSVGPYCDLNQDVDSKDYKHGAVVSLVMDENERECNHFSNLYIS